MPINPVIDGVEPFSFIQTMKFVISSHQTLVCISIVLHINWSLGRKNMRLLLQHWDLSPGWKETGSIMAGVPQAFVELVRDVKNQLDMD